MLHGKGEQNSSLDQRISLNLRQCKLYKYGRIERIKVVLVEQRRTNKWLDIGSATG